MIKRFIIAFILLVLVGGGIVGFNLFRDRAIEQYFANRPVAPLTVSTVRVEPVTWKPGIEAIGTVAAAQGVDLSVETSGVVKEILFRANDRVGQGQLLLRLDDAVEQADLAAAKTKAALDQQALERAQALRKSGAGTQATLDSAQAAASTSKSQVAKLQAMADQKLLTAPFSGTVGIPRIEPGQYLAPGNSVVTLQNLETMRVDFTVPEQKFADLEFGQAVTLGLAADNMAYKGSITGIDPKIDPSSRLVSVRAQVSNSDGHLSPGQFVQVRVEQPSEDGIIAIPQTALTASLYGDYVFVVSAADNKPETDMPDQGPTQGPARGQAKGTAAAAPQEAGQPLVAHQVFIKTGRRSDGRVEVVQGLQGGEQVVTAGQNRLSNGAPVKVDNTVDPTALLPKEGAPQ